MGKKNIFDSIGKGLSDGGKWIGHTAEKGGKWAGHAAEDTFHWGEKTGSQVGNRLLNFGDDQLSKLTGIFGSPTFLIVAGVVVVAIIILK